MYKIVVFGDLPIATKVVMFLEEHIEADIQVVIGNDSPNNHDPWDNVPVLADYCKMKQIPVTTLEALEALPDQSITLGVSCRFSKIIKESVIHKFSMGIINCHGGLNPEFQGVYSSNHTILQNSPIGGGTIHYMNAEIDAGDLIKRCEFSVSPDDTAFTVFQKTQMVLEEELEKIIPEALIRALPTVSLEQLVEEGHQRAYYNKRSLDGRREIHFGTMEPDEIDRIIRAFDFPGYEPAYYLNGAGKKVYLRYEY